MSTGCTLFDTALGSCGVAWSTTGITAIQLPEATPEATLKLLVKRSGTGASEPPGWVREVAAKITRLVAGEPETLIEVPIDLGPTTDFTRRVYDEARRLKPGETLTYGALAARAGSARGARAVGAAMARNPIPLVIPCHRVLGAGGTPVGFSAFGGVKTKVALLATEGALHAVKGEAPTAQFGADNFDESAVRAWLSRKDKTLGRCITQVGPLGMVPDRSQSPYEALARSVVYQQLHGSAASTILGRLKAHSPDGRVPPPEVLLALDDAAMRSVGLSGSKTAALRDLAQKTLEGSIPDSAALECMRDEEIVLKLTTVRGVGRWTVEMMLMFRMGRPDVLPVSDFGVRKGFQRLFKLKEMPSAQEMLARAERWRPWRSAASWYLWRVLDAPRATRHAPREPS